MSARQCAMFRRGLAQALEKVNQLIVPMKVQIRRFQVMCVLYVLCMFFLCLLSIFDSCESGAVMSCFYVTV